MKHVANAGRPPINNNIELDVILSVAETPQLISRQIEKSGTGISERSFLRVLKKEKYHSYKI